MHLVSIITMMKSLMPILLLMLSLSLLGCGNKRFVLMADDAALAPGYATGRGEHVSQIPDWRYYHLDTVNGGRMITFYDHALGDEELLQLASISSARKRSTVYTLALLDSDTVVLLDLNPGRNRTYDAGETCSVKARKITCFRVPYHSLPLVVFVFENDSLWQHFDDIKPMYLRMDDNIRLEHQDIIKARLNL